MTHTIDNGALSWLMVRGPLAAAAPIIGTLASAGGSIMGAMGTASADKFKAQQLEEEAQYGELRATQTNAQMTRNLSNTLANIDAVRAARHDSPLSPTGAEVRGQTEFLGEEQKNIAVTNIMAQARTDEESAQYLRSASSMALLGGALGAGAGLFKGLSGAFASGTAGTAGVGGGGASGADIGIPGLY